MPKALAILGIAISSLLLLIFGLDAFLGFPFGGEAFWTDIIFCVCAIVLAYLGYSTYREQR
jgi:hypothetical protein